MFYSVDKIENGYAVCTDDNGKRVRVRLESIDSRIKEGSVLIMDESGKFKADSVEEKKRRAANFDLASKLFK
ncbi:MAG: DUF3006 domain-containing protein [Clostridia bacterium]|nr:DUF3006 domain-containing protein [Clostridia bacterium]